MKGNGNVAVAGLGVVGKPLAALLSESYEVTAFGIGPPFVGGAAAHFGC